MNDAASILWADFTPPTGMERMMRVSRITPPTYLLLALILMIVLHFFLPLTTLIPSPWNLLGGLPLALGIVLNLKADQAIHQARTTVSPFEVPSTLITQGPYLLTRNPMYLGFVLILLGTGMLLGSLAVYAVVFGYALLVDRLFIEKEERNLTAGFGSQWQAYKDRTRRWL